VRTKEIPGVIEVALALFDKAGFKVEEHVSEGFHASNNRRDHLNLFAALLFQGKDQQ
jgi:hypothetical protein